VPARLVPTEAFLTECLQRIPSTMENLGEWKPWGVEASDDESLQQQMPLEETEVEEHRSGEDARALHT
jgi:hypothetical protein